MNNSEQVQRDEEFDYFAKSFKGSKHEVVVTLRTLKKSPYPEARIIPFIEALLDDRSPCVTGIPYRYGETRWLAAGALRRVYDALGIRESIVLHDVPVTLSSDQLGDLARESGTCGEWTDLGAEDLYLRLRDTGKLPVSDLVLEWANVDD
ncbi:hypothetical protein FEK33_18635 [Nocardia asteroides NBRC 15531]|uniref:Uncharacterized protein n=1 Tax=Nocardia asteroides NBRC 15531 TaxID=1110697 RepID=U5ECM6_NOCAS|nr:hypothetical protein [Nocardia asteroides]TLF65345.1 hypothetical protein FEK33_18635 [Nocardia asteroides NBRC 15531]UGT47905.1 hypothetical protein LT345_25995 [Nocardia asteroides]GAD82944.1 hypothetical protein NCAST_13_02190 [Nocardia asteroides NBRC 15531]